MKYTIEKAVSWKSYGKNGNVGLESERHALWLVKDETGRVVDQGSQFRKLMKWWPTAKKIDPKRPNPPKNIDSMNAFGGECVVFSIAVATGTPLRAVRQAFLDVGADIWGEKGYASGATDMETRKVIAKLDMEKRIVRLGHASGGARGMIGVAKRTRFMIGTNNEPFQPLGAETVMKSATIGSLVEEAKREGLALIAFTGKYSIIRGPSHTGTVAPRSGHAVAYSPSHGFLDTSMDNDLSLGSPLVERVAKGEILTTMDWKSHGEKVPQPRRPALFWLFFKGE